jgi:hypothetical protein
MTEYLAQHLVCLGDRGLGADADAKPRLDHVERRFNIQAALIVAQKLVAAFFMGSAAILCATALQ